MLVLSLKEMSSCDRVEKAGPFQQTPAKKARAVTHIPSSLIFRDIARGLVTAARRAKLAFDDSIAAGVVDHRPVQFRLKNNQFAADNPEARHYEHIPRRGLAVTL